MMREVRLASVSEDEELAKWELQFAQQLATQIRPTTNVLTIRQETCKDAPSAFQLFAFFPCQVVECGFTTKYSVKLKKHMESVRASILPI